MSWFKRGPSVTELFLAALAAQNETHKAVVEAVVKATAVQAEALGNQAKSFASYLDAFKVVEAPQKRIVTDQDEVDAEVQRLREAGFPVDLSPEKQLKWVDHAANMAELAASF